MIIIIQHITKLIVYAQDIDLRGTHGLTPATWKFVQVVDIWVDNQMMSKHSPGTKVPGGVVMLGAFLRENKLFTIPMLKNLQKVAKNAIIYS